MVPVIARSGGKAFVGASVEEISFEGERAAGVVVRHKGLRHLIRAPHVISSVGLFETVGMIPQETTEYSELGDLSRNSFTLDSVYIGIGYTVFLAITAIF